MKRRLDTVIKSLSVSNAAIKNTASPIEKVGWFPAFSASGQDVWLPDYRFDQRGIVVSAVGARCGKVFKAEGKWNVCANTHALSVDESIADRDYCWYMLNNESWWIKGGTAQPFVKVKDSLKREHDFPSLENQRRIVQELTQATLIVEMRQKELRVLDDLIKARFVEMFGDPVTNPNGYLVQTLQQLIDCGVITYHLDGNHGGDYPRSEEFVDVGVPYIGANCISNGEIDFSMAKYLTEDRAGKLRKGIARNEDVLFAHNATVGPTVVLHTDLPKVILSTSLTAYRCNQELIKPNYLKAYMQSDGFVRQYFGEMKQTTRNQVPITAQKKYLFLVPPLEEQEQFAAFVAQVDKSKVAVQKALDEAQLLFDSLMQRYFG